MAASPNPATGLAAREGSRTLDWIRAGLRAEGKGGKEVDTTKQGYTWLKDVYNFAHASKDNLDDPDVQHIIDQKMQKLQSTGFLTGRPEFGRRQTETVVGPDGLATQAPRPEEYTLNDISQMYQRFQMENPAQYKPHEVSTVGAGGQTVTRRTDPISGQVTDYDAPPTIMSEGQEAGVFAKDDKGSPIFTRTHKVAKTATPKDPSDVSGKKLAHKIGDPTVTRYVLPDKDGNPPEGFTFKAEPVPKGQMTEKNEADILHDVEQTIQTWREEDYEPTQSDIDAMNRQLALTKIKERVSREDIILDERWYWFDKKGKGGVVKTPEQKSLADIFKK